MSGRRVLVTGGAGFIGSHICEELDRTGSQPIVFDNLSSGSVDNLEGIRHELIREDVRDVRALDAAVASCDAVIHLAAQPSVQVSVEDPLGTHSINYTSTLGLLECMRRSRNKRLVYASSAAVYPKALASPASEDDFPRPSTPYGLDKLSGEHAIRIYSELHAISGTSCRFFNVYGERQDPRSPYSGVISIFAESLILERSCRIFGDGLQSRDFVYVRDLSRLVVELLWSEAPPALVNVGTGHATSLLELLDGMEEVLGRTAHIDFQPARPGDIRHSSANVTRLRSCSNWKPRDIREGLEQMFSQIVPRA